MDAVSLWADHVPHKTLSCQQRSTGKVMRMSACVPLSWHGLLQAFLRCRGLALEGCSVVRQTQVTHLADANSKSWQCSADLNTNGISVISTDESMG